MPTTAPRQFLTTHWSVVLAARRDSSPGAPAALETLCRTYWYPLYAYVRRSGHSPEDAKDFTQEFFARLLEKNWLHSVAPEHGRFRSFLLVAMKRFLAKEWRREHAQKRGAGGTILPLEPVDAETRYGVEPAVGADVLFERRWALTLLQRALDRVEGEFETAGKRAEFDVMKDWLTADRGEIPYEEAAQKLGTTEGAARVAIHRLRKQFRAVFREVIAETVSEPAEVEDEMRHLAAALGRNA
jgi:RNA polymerase sigma factor (sigma-70 family)